MHWLYLHGFLSSAKSAKAQSLAHWLAANHSDVKFGAPTLPFNPLTVVEIIEALVADAADTSQPVTGLIGSSLGGFYARLISARTGLPAVLINPALRPDLLFENYLGEQTNPYTGETYDLQTADLRLLRDMVVQNDPRPRRLFLLIQMNDETLDSAQTVVDLRESPAWIQSGGSHRFDAFERTFPAIRAFLSSGTC
ncbi:YqiA/YcfP family alpha/beta fold hydrolase [Allohahella sp. A8]|uniref:YqiA/YcfP family alpha/beta fold hydrolase n=1 Tax=Allohahella sp. A8 TaxID=3141461 RepID=UPI003A80BCCF